MKWGKSNPLRKSSCGEDLGTNSELIDEIFFHCITNSGLVALSDLPNRGNLNGWIDDVLCPITLTRRDVARQRKIRQAGKSNIVRSSNSGFQHASAPHRDAMITAYIVH